MLVQNRINQVEGDEGVAMGIDAEILATYIGGYAMMLTRAFGGVGGI